MRLSAFASMSLALLGALLAAPAGCATARKVLAGAFEEPEVEFRELHLRKLSFERVSADFEFLVSNPNDLAVTVSSLDYALSVDEKSLAEGTSSRELRLEARGSAPVHLPLTIAFADFVDNLATFFSSREAVPYAIAAKLGVKTPVGPVQVPVQHEGTLPLPKVPDIEVADVRLTRLDLTGAEVELALDVRNRGQFPIQPQGLRYDVSLAGTSVASGNETLPTLAANASEQVVLSIDLSFLRLGPTLVEAVRSRRVPYRVAGAVDLGVFAPSFDSSGTAEL